MNSQIAKRAATTDPPRSTTNTPPKFLSPNSVKELEALLTH